MVDRTNSRPPPRSLHNTRQHKEACMATKLCGPTLLMFIIGFGTLAVMSLMIVSMALPHPQQQHPQQQTNNVHTDTTMKQENHNENKIITVTPISPISMLTSPPVQVTMTAIATVAAATAVSNNNNSSSSSSINSSPINSPNIRRESPLNPWKKKKGSIDLHFIHIPKCGGTSMTGILREVLCTIDPDRNQDCCTNPGFCDYNDNRKCNAIRGCINHFANRPWIFKPQPSITILREPVSRLLSAWFYRGHSPNLDFFQVRPWFKEIKDGKRPKVIFQEYIEMVEYQNIQTRMLGADSFPYRDVPITPQVYEQAVDALNHLFFVGLQEAYDISVQVMIRELGVPVQVEVRKERDQQNSKSLLKQKQAIKTNETLLTRVREVNSYDMKLYQLGVIKFCTSAKKYTDLYELVRTTTKVDCDTALRQANRRV